MDKTLTKIERHLIEEVKRRRKQLGLSQLALSQKLEMSDSFVSHVESEKKRTKYNVRHLNDIAKIFGCSPKDFWPEKPL